MIYNTRRLLHLHGFSLYWPGLVPAWPGGCVIPTVPLKAELDNQLHFRILVQVEACQIDAQYWGQLFLRPY